MRALLQFLGRRLAQRKRLRGALSYYAEAASAELGRARDAEYAAIYERFCGFTRIPRTAYVANLRLVERFRAIDGCVVECGTWRGGMIAGIAALLGASRSYFLFDSFQGLPDAASIDGERALRWLDENATRCETEERFVHDAMQAAGARQYVVHAGWFHETLPRMALQQRIAILRLDADWYSSTAECLNHLYDRVVVGGLIIVDDYYTWDGCSRAVHDFLSHNASADRIQEEPPNVAYLRKSSGGPSVPINPRRGESTR